MRDLKKFFMVMCTTLIMFMVFFLLDIAVAFIVSLPFKLISAGVSFKAFKMSMTILIVGQVLFSIPVLIKTIKEEDKGGSNSGT